MDTPGPGPMGVPGPPGSQDRPTWWDSFEHGVRLRALGLKYRLEYRWWCWFVNPQRRRWRWPGRKQKRGGG